MTNEQEIPEVGTRVWFTCDMHVGHEGIIPKRSQGVYRGISDDVERYHLIEMDADHGFLEDVYGYKNIYLAVEFADIEWIVPDD